HRRARRRRARRAACARLPLPRLRHRLLPAARRGAQGRGGVPELTDPRPPFRIWFERTLPEAYRALLEGAAVIVDGPSVAEAIVAAARVRYDGALMDGAPELRVISRTGVGLDNISV